MTSVVDRFLPLRQPSQFPMREATSSPGPRHESRGDIQNGAGEQRISAADLNSNPGKAFAFFYCRRADAERRKPENILRSFLKQLALSHDKSLASLRTKYVEKKRQGFLSNSLSLTECQELLVKMVSLCPETILILDALDECEEDSRHNLIAVFNEVVEQSLPVRILISSRRDDDIAAEFGDRANFNLSATDNGHDIMKFVRGKIKEYRNSKISKRRINSAMSVELEQQIIDIFLEKSDGMLVVILNFASR